MAAKRKRASRRLTVAHVVEELGGPAETGRMCGRSSQAVSQWGEDGIPELSAYRLAHHADCPFEFEDLPVKMAV